MAQRADGDAPAGSELERVSAPAGAGRGAARRHQVLRRHRGRPRRVAGAACRRGAGVAGRERRRQEHLRQAAGRRPPPGHGRGPAGWRGRPARARRSMPSATASRSCTSIPACSRISASPRTSSSAMAPPAGFGLLDRARMRRDAARLLDMVGLDCGPEAPLAGLRSSEQQLVEIARALSVRARVLIMDEPTAALSQREVDRLFAVVDDLRRQGVAMMFVGHRMDEIYRVADRVTVLRDGRLVATAPTDEMPRDRAVRLMVGRALSHMYPERERRTRRRGAGGDRPRPRRRLRRRLARGARRRDPGLRRPRRQRAHRDRARPVRRRPADRRHDRAGRPRRSRSPRPATPWRPASPTSRRTGSARAW